MTLEPTVQPGELWRITRLKLVAGRLSVKEECPNCLPVVGAGPLEFEIVHAMSGRLRLKVPGIRADIEFEQRVQAAVSAYTGRDQRTHQPFGGQPGGRVCR